MCTCAARAPCLKSERRHILPTPTPDCRFVPTAGGSHFSVNLLFQGASRDSPAASLTLALRRNKITGPRFLIPLFKNACILKLRFSPPVPSTALFFSAPSSTAGAKGENEGAAAAGRGGEGVEAERNLDKHSSCSLARRFAPKQTGPSWSGFNCRSPGNELHLSKANLTVYLVSPHITVTGTFL